MNSDASTALAKLLYLDSEVPDTISTDSLIRNFDAKATENKHNNDDIFDNNSKKKNDTLDSTSALIDAEIIKRSSSQWIEPSNVSESTMLIQEDNAIRPARRPVSGSSMQMKNDISDTDIFFQEISHTSKANSQAAAEGAEELNKELLINLLCTLPQTTRNIAFTEIFSEYLKLLEEYEANTAKDRFVITVFNQLHLHGTSSAKLNRVIDVFLSNPANLAMKLSNFSYYQNIKVRDKIFKIWLIKFRKSSDIKKSRIVWNLYLKRKYFEDWIYKYNVVTEDFVSNAVIFGCVKKLIKSWDVWNFKLKQLDKYNDIAGYQQQQKFFSKWRTKMTSKYAKADSFHEQLLMERVLKQWKLKKLSRFSTILLSQRYFDKWTEEGRRLKELENDGTRLEFALHVGFIFGKWRDNAFKLIAESVRLEEVYSYVLMDKYFKLLKQYLYYKNIENEVKLQRQQIMKSFALNSWKTRLSHQLKLIQLQKKQNSEITAKYFRIWYNQKQLFMKTHSIFKAYLPKVYFKNWKLQTNLKIYKSNKSIELVETHWLKLIDQHRLRTSLKDFELMILSKYWNKIIMRKLKADDLLTLSGKALVSYTKIIFFKSWKSVLHLQEDNEKRAIHAILRKAFDRLKFKVEHNATLNRIADDYHSFDCKIFLMKQFFHKWKKRVEINKELELDGLRVTFRAYSQSLMKKSVIKLWETYYRSYVKLDKLCEEQISKKQYSLPILKNWIAKYREVLDMERKADEINSLNLLSSGFTKIQLSMLKLEELKLKLQEAENNSNLKLILRYLNVWSVKLLKMKRDNETILNFRKRWQRAQLRAILLLWKGKFGSAVLEFNSTDSEIDDSPTKFRSRSTRLTTETPKRIIKYGELSNTKSSIPGSERIKHRRMEALKNHYSQVKRAIPSPFIDKNRDIAVADYNSRKLNFTAVQVPRNFHIDESESS